MALYNRSSENWIHNFHVSELIQLRIYPAIIIIYKKKTVELPFSPLLEKCASTLLNYKLVYLNGPVSQINILVHHARKYMHL